MERTVRLYKEWHKSYELFVAYQKEFPDVPVTQGAKYHNYKLGHWVHMQRQAKKNGILSPERIKLLEEVGFIWDAQEEAWEQGYKAFVAYQKEFLDKVVPQKVKYNGYNLGRWVVTQRVAHKKGTISSERIQRLEEAGFVWEIYKSATEVIAMFERGEDVSTSIRGLPISMRKYLWEKYNNSCAIGQVDLNNFTILPESFLILDGKICGFKGKKPNGNPNLDIAHLDDIYSNNTIKNLLPLCPNCHGSITYSFKQTKEHLRKANVTSRRRRGSKTRQSIPSD